MLKKYLIKFVKTILPLALGVYLVWHSFSNLSAQDLDTFYDKLREANYFWIVFALLFSVIALFSRAYRWSLALEPIGHQTKFWNRYHAIMIGYLINFTIPRAGEASRAGMLYKSEGVPFGTSFGTIVAERAIDFIVLAGIGLFTAFLAYDDFFILLNEVQTFDFKSTDSLKTTDDFSLMSILLFIGGVFLITGLIIFFKHKKFQRKVIEFVKNVFAGLISIFKVKSPSKYILHTLIIWFAYILMFVFPFFSLEETVDFPFKGYLLGFIAGSLGIILTNGGIGTYPILVGLVVAFYIKGDYPEQALAIGTALGWIIWLSQTVLMIILGLISLALLPNNFEKTDESH